MLQKASKCLIMPDNALKWYEKQFKAVQREILYCYTLFAIRMFVGLNENIDFI